MVIQRSTEYPESDENKYLGDDALLLSAQVRSLQSKVIRKFL